MSCGSLGSPKKAGAIGDIQGGFTHDGMVIEGGKEYKRKLAIAKKETYFCFVIDLDSKKAVKLLLKDGNWIPENTH